MLTLGMSAFGVKRTSLIRSLMSAMTHFRSHSAVAIMGPFAEKGRVHLAL